MDSQIEQNCGRKMASSSQQSQLEKETNVYTISYINYVITALEVDDSLLIVLLFSLF